MDYFNWDVIERPIFNEQGQVIRGYKQIQRDDSKEVLNVTTDRYYPILNATFEDVIGTFTEDLDCKVVKHGTFNRGKKIYVQFENNEFVDTVIDGDENGQIKGYGTLVNSHDGTHSFKFFSTVVRIFCKNTFTQAVKNSNINFSAKHTKNHRNKIDTFTDTISGIADAQKLIKENIDYMVTQNSFNSPKEYAKKLFNLEKKPRPINRKNKQGIYQTKGWTPPQYSGRGENIMKRYTDIYEMYGEIEPNNWRMFNVTTDDIDHGGRPKEYGLIGNGNTIKSRAFNLLTV